MTLVHCGELASFWYLDYDGKHVHARCSCHQFDLNLLTEMKPISFEEAIVISIISK